MTTAVQNTEQVDEPLKYSVLDFIQAVDDPTVINDRMFPVLVERANRYLGRPVRSRDIMERNNDMFGKIILRHGFGERIAIVYRLWCYTYIDWSEELEDGGAGIEDWDTRKEAA